MNKKAFDFNTLSDKGLTLQQSGEMYNDFVKDKIYDWWYEVLPDDVVVDIGACAGWFSAKALDAGAEHVYMIEPSRALLKTACYNTADYIMDTVEQKVTPINYAIGKYERDKHNVFSTPSDNNEIVKMMSFGELLYKHKLDHIDFLKIDAQGAEFNILTEDNLEFFTNNVRHIAVRLHVGAFEDSPHQFIHFRDNFLKEFLELSKVRFCGDIYHELIYDDQWVFGVKEGLPRKFMMFITNY